MPIHLPSTGRTIEYAPELAAVLNHAQDIAEESEQRLCSIHFLLALFIVPNDADEEMRRHQINEDRLIASLAEATQLYDEPDDSLDRIERQLAQVAESTSHSAANCLHLLAALARVQASSAFRLLKRMNIDVNTMRSRIIGRLSKGPADGLPASRQVAPVAPPPMQDESGSNDDRVFASRELEPAPPPAVPPPRLVQPTPIEAMHPSAAATAPSRPPPPPAPSAPRPMAPPPATPTAAPRPLTTTVAAPEREPYALSPEDYPQLSQFGRNVTLRAAQGKVDPVVGREREVEELIDILGKRRANNPCLIGEPGVGKTAVVESLALRMLQMSGRDQRIIVELDMGGLVAGTQLRGSLQERLDGLKKEVRRAEGRVVIFIDELHTLVGAGATGEGAQDAANELKAALARGEFPCIGATTPAEYTKHIESDAALARRFQPVYLEEPTQAQALAILRGTIVHYAEHHRVSYEDDALEAAVRLSVRYLRDRRLPDKAINIVDLAGARARREGHTAVDRADVARVVASLAHLPEEKLLQSDAERLMRLEEMLGKSIVGHAEVVQVVSQALRRSSAGFSSRRPMGAFLFLGPTGVGKTELAKGLADTLFQGRDAVVRFDMSEFAESHALSRLVGSPPGYLGHDEGGQLTEAVRRRPYSLVLFDEIEKAHRDVLQLLLQLLDEGRLTDSRGRTVDFTSTVVVMTSNLGSERFRVGRRVGFAAGPADLGGVRDAVLGDVRKALSPELWNRIEHRLVFMPLCEAEVREIARRQLSASAAQLEEERGITFRIDESVLDHLIAHGGLDPELGARPMRQTIERLVEGELAHRILRGELHSGDAVRITRQGDALSFLQEL